MNNTKPLKLQVEDPGRKVIHFGLSPSSSHHQDHYILVGDPYKPSFVTGILGRGTTQNTLSIRFCKVTHPQSEGLSSAKKNDYFFRGKFNALYK